MPDHKPFLLIDPDDAPDQFEMAIFSEYGLLMGGGADFTYANSLRPVVPTFQAKPANSQGQRMIPQPAQQQQANARNLHGSRLRMP